MKIMRKMPFLLVMVLLLSVGMGFSANAADVVVEKKPYEYDFVANTGNLYNGFKGAKDLVITFDKSIIKPANSAVRVEQIISETEKIVLPIVGSFEVTSQLPNVLTIKFKNLELIDQSKGLNFKLIIDKEVLYPDQLTVYEFPFKLPDLLPGFASTFLDPSNAGLINNNIFKQNEPRAVMVHVPPLYMTKIETIHRYKGVIGDKDKGKVGPSLSSIDILANKEATRLKVNFSKTTDNVQYDRDLERSISKLNGFSMGQAGIEGVCVTTDKGAATPNICGNDEFNLRAFNKYGRLLATKNLKMEVKDEIKDFKVSTYIKASEKSFGKDYSLYDLMATPKLMDEIMNGIEVSAFDSLGVSYSLGDTIEISNLEQLEMALENKSFKTIQLKNNISLTNDLTIGRSVTIEATNTGISLNGAKLILGKGTEDITVYVKKLTVEAGIVVDVGANGTAVLKDIPTAPPTPITIQSGGINSVHLINSALPVVLVNTTPVRVVTDKEILDITINGTNEVTLEGIFKKVTVINASAKLNMKKNTVINEISNISGSEYKVFIPKGTEKPLISSGGNVVFEVVERPSVSEPGTSEKVLLTVGPLNWNLNTSVTNDITLDIGRDADEKEALKNVIWNTSNSKIFGVNSLMIFTAGKLTISDLDLLEVKPYKLILNGTSSTGIEYEVTISVNLTVTAK